MESVCRSNLPSHGFHHRHQKVHRRKYPQQRSRFRQVQFRFQKVRGKWNSTEYLFGAETETCSFAKQFVDEQINPTLITVDDGDSSGDFTDALQMNQTGHNTMLGNKYSLVTI